MMRFVILTTNFTNPTNVGYVSHSLDLLYSWFVNFMMRSVVLTTNFTNPTNVGCVSHSSDSLYSWFKKLHDALCYFNH